MKILTIESSKRDRKQYYIEYYAANRERISKRKKAHYKANVEEYRQKLRADYHANIEKKREQARYYSKKYYATNPEKYRIKKIKYKANNQELVNLQARAYAANDKAKKLGLNADKYTANDIKVQMLLQSGLCWWCSKKIKGLQFQVDHRMPLSKGGENNASNIVIACPHCNKSKANKTPMEYCGRLF